MRRFTFFTKRSRYYKLFDAVLENLRKSTDLLLSIMLDDTFAHVGYKVDEMQEIEREGDILTHAIIEELHTSSLNSQDKNDIHALASKLDDIVDNIWNATVKIMIFRLPKPGEEAMRISKNLSVLAELLSQAIHTVVIQRFYDVQDCCFGIKKIEKRIDEQFTAALKRIFAEYNDPVMVLKWRDVLEHLECAADCGEEVGKILQGIVYKNTH